MLLGLAMLIFFAPFFNITAITITRSEIDSEYKVSDEQIMAASGLVIGKNIFATDITRAQASIMTLPYVQEVEVKRVFPNKIKITLGEAARAACVQCETGFAVIDMHGKIMELPESVEDCNIPRLLGFDIIDAEIGQVIPSDGNPLFAASLKVLKALDETGLLSKTQSIDSSDLNSIEVMIGDKMQILISNDSDLNYRLRFIKKVMDEKLSPYESVTLDYRGADLSVRSYKAPVKPSESPKEEVSDSND